MERRAGFFSVVSAFGYERVACALLQYRPPTPVMLAAVLSCEQKKQAAVSYFGNTLWRMMMFFHPDSKVPIFSRYMQELGKPVEQKSGPEIVQDLIGKLRQREGR